MMKFTMNEKLAEPLLDLDETEVSYADDDDESVACGCSIALGAVDEECEEDKDETTVTCRDTTVLLLFFPLLLMAQFGMVFRNPMVDASLDASWSTVNYVIVMFAVTSWLYRHTLADLKISNLLLLVVPEIMLNVILALVLWDNAAAGFVGLLGCLFVLGLFVTGSSLRILICSDCHRNDADDVVEEDIQQAAFEAVAL